MPTRCDNCGSDDATDVVTVYELRRGRGVGARSYDHSRPRKWCVDCRKAERRSWKFVNAVERDRCKRGLNSIVGEGLRR